MESQARYFDNVGGTDRVVASVKGCVVFDSATGVIQHVHQVVTIDGADETTDDEVARRALTFARERLDSGTALPGETAIRAVEGELAVLPFDPTRLDLSRPHRVDPQTRSLVPDERATS
jgi:hypothetical protein